jgi:hypothetical protein
VGYERELSSLETCDEWPGIEILITGHVDFDYQEDGSTLVLVRFDGEPLLCDIKTLSTNNFEEIVGIKNLVEGSYAAEKRSEAISQANAYAKISQDDFYTIWWVNKDDLRSKFELFQMSQDAYHAEIVRLCGIIAHVNTSINTGDEDLPPFDGVHSCHWCSQMGKHCLGEKKLRTMRVV